MAECVGWSARRVQEEMDVEELAGWAVYLGSPFARQSQDDLRAGWLAHIVRCALAGSRSRPKFADSVPPVRRMQEFWVEDGKGGGAAPPSRQGIPVDVMLAGRRKVAEAAAAWRAEQEGWKAGTVMRDGLYIHEKRGGGGGCP